MAKAVPLKRADTGAWTSRLNLPVGDSLDFKFLSKATDDRPHWEGGLNRSYTVPPETPPALAYRWRPPPPPV
jgi:hypothetical protein